MKRVLLSLFAALAAFAAGSAQSFEFRYNGEPIEDGATLEYESMRDILPGHEYVCVPRLFTVANVSASPLMFTASLRITENSMEAPARMCTGGQCDYLEMQFWSGSFTVAPGETEALQYEAWPSKPGTMTTVFTATAAGETKTVNFLFKHSVASGITEATTEASLYDVYSLSGSLVGHSLAPAALRKLPAGAYIVRPVGDAGGTSVKKVIVR